MQTNKSIGGTHEPESHYACIVYHQHTGGIHHVHQVINLPGAKAPSREEMKQSALRHSAEGASSDLAVLLVPGGEVERGKVYHVDHAKQALVAERERTPGRREAGSV